MSMTIQLSVKDKILATSSETSKVENAPAEMLRDLDQQMEKRADDGCTLWIKLYSKYEYEIRYHPGKANVVIDVLRRKERVKPRRVRAMAMTIQYGVRGMILASQSEAFKKENVLAERLHGLRYLSENEIESPWILSVNFQGQSSEYDVIWVMEWNSGDDQLRLRWMIYPVVLADAVEGVREAIGFEYWVASSSGWTKSLVLWAEIGESSLTGPELVLDTTDKVTTIEGVALEGRSAFLKEGLRLPEELSGVHDTFHVSNLKKYLADANLHVPLNEIKIDKTLCFVKEPVEIMDYEIKKLKRSKIFLFL
ncbi:hypothetical protein Tco_0529548 [Tanacetum coccineum]